MASFASSQTALERFEMLVARERVLQERKGRECPAGKKPPQELINAIGSARKAKRDFLETLSPEDRDEIDAKFRAEASNGPQRPRKGKAKSQSSPEERRQLLSQRISAIEKYAIPGHELVDIGINVHGRCSAREIMEQLERAWAAKVTKIILTGCSIESTKKGISVCEKWHSENVPSREAASESPLTGGFSRIAPVQLFATAGIHPHDAKTVVDKNNGAFLEHKFQELRNLAANRFCVSIGECGLDYDRMFSPREAQRTVFEAQVQLACELGKPLFVHLRELDKSKGPPIGAFDDAAEILERFCDRLVASKVCVHCFTGDAKDLHLLTSRGFMVGFTGYVGIEGRARESGTLDAISGAKNLPIDQIMLETDAPFMRPSKKWLPKETGLGNGRNNEPASMPAVCRAFAAAFDGGAHSPEEIAQKTTENAIRFFALQ